MALLTLLWRLLVFACAFLIIGQLFGVCVFPESEGYATRMICIEGEWKRKTSLLFRYLDYRTDNTVKDTLHSDAITGEPAVDF